MNFRRSWRKLVCTAALVAVLVGTGASFGFDTQGARAAGADEAAAGASFLGEKNSGSRKFLDVASAWALAEEHHPRVVQARATLASLERDLRQRENAYMPTVTVSASGFSAELSRTGEWRVPNPRASLSASLKLPSGWSVSASINSPSGSSTRDDNEWRGSFSVEYPLFRSAALDSDAQALRQAELALVAAQREAEQLRDEVRAEVLAAMYAEQVAAVRLELARAGYADAVAAWDVVQQQMELGIVTEAEFLAAQIELLRAEQDRLTAERTWQARRSELAALLGVDDIGAYEFESVLTWTAMPLPGDPEEAAARAVANSLTVWERWQAVETAELQLAAERERSGLTGQLRGEYLPPTNDTSEQRSQSQAQARVTLSLSYPLYDGGQRRMALQAREEAVERAREALVQAEQEVRARVADLFVQLEEAGRDVEIAALELRRAELELTAVLRQAELTVASAGPGDVERARRGFVRAELSYLEAVQRYQARWIELQRLQGPVPWEQLMGAEESAAEPTVVGVDGAVHGGAADGEARP